MNANPARKLRIDTSLIHPVVYEQFVFQIDQLRGLRGIQLTHHIYERVLKCVRDHQDNQQESSKRSTLRNFNQDGSLHQPGFQTVTSTISPIAAKNNDTSKEAK